MENSPLCHRIALVTPDYPPIPGGISISVSRLAKNLSALGHTIAVVVPHLSKIPLSRPQQTVRHEEGYDVVDLLIADPGMGAGAPWSLSHLGRMPQTFLALRRWASKWKPDVLHSFTLFPFALLTGLVAHELSIPFVVGARGNDVDSNLFRPDVVGSIALACRNADRVFPVTQDLANHLLFLCPEIERERICVVSNGIDQGTIPTNSAHAGTNTTGAIVYGTLCEIRPKKDLDILLTAFERLHREHTNTRLVIAGSFPADEISPDAFSDGFAGDAVTFLGRVQPSDVSSVLRTFDVFVLPSAIDGCPNTLLEAMVEGCAVVGSSAGGCKDLIRHGETGLLFPPLDEDALLSMMRDLLSLPTRRKLGINATKCVRSGRTEALEYSIAYSAVLAEHKS